MKHQLSRCHNIDDLRRTAQRRLPAPMFHYLDGGSDDEWTLRRNTEAFADYELQPDYLVDIRSIDLHTTVLGLKLELPFFLAPTGMSRLFHHEKEFGAARAAARFGTLYTLSTVATTSIEDIAAVSEFPKMFQVYIFRDRGLTEEFVHRCREAGYQALCLTVDTPVAGNRERDRVTGMTLPPRLGLKSLWSLAAHPYWTMNFALHPDFRLANVAHRVDALAGRAMGVAEYIHRQFDRSVTWKDAEWLARQWGGPLVIKGLQTVADARRAAEIGATGIMVSNHGGRQLDGTAAAIDCIAGIADAVGDRVDIICDGGIRRGTHIIKALAVGARACSIGRPYLYGLAAGGQAGVERALYLLKTELERDLALLGCRNIGEIGTRHVLRRTGRGI